VAKVIVNVLFAGFMCCASATSTNLAQIVGRNFDSVLISGIPCRDFSTPERAYLNFVRALATTNEADWVAGFLPQKMIEYAGTDNPDSLTGMPDSPLVEIFEGCVISNMVVTSYSTKHVAKDTVRIAADIVSCHGLSVQTNTYPVTFAKVDDQWKIIEFLDDE